MMHRWAVWQLPSLISLFDQVAIWHNMQILFSHDYCGMLVFLLRLCQESCSTSLNSPITGMSAECLHVFFVFRVKILDCKEVCVHSTRVCISGQRGMFARLFANAVMANGTFGRQVKSHSLITSRENEDNGKWWTVYLHIDGSRSIRLCNEICAERKVLIKSGC